MEGNLPSGNMIPFHNSYGGLELQGSMRVHHRQPECLSLPRQGSVVQSSTYDDFPLTISSMQNCDQSISLADLPKEVSDEDELSFMEAAIDGHNDANRGKEGMPWQRVKWTDKMVRLLITAVSYIGEDVAAEYGNATRRRYANLQKRGKWKLVSKVMAERDHYVSPQQCEDKFNDLNKRYKRLNEILGRGTSCQVVERLELLDSMDNLSEKGKEEVRKILSSKHLFYEEMCSYHNGNRLHLPHDPELQHSLWLALRTREDHENIDVRSYPHDYLDKDDQDAETDHRDEFEEIHDLLGDRRVIYGVPGGSAKRMKQCQGHKNISAGNSLNSLGCNGTFHSYPQNAQANMNKLLPEGVKAGMLQKQWMKQRLRQFEEQQLQIQAQMLELEKERLKWQRLCRKGDQKLERMRIENELMKLGNEHMALELKGKEMGANITKIALKCQGSVLER